MKMMSFSHWGLFEVPSDTEYRMSYGTTYQRLNFGPELT